MYTFRVFYELYDVGRLLIKIEKVKSFIISFWGNFECNIFILDLILLNKMIGVYLLM